MRTLRYENGGVQGDPPKSNTFDSEAFKKGISLVESGGGQEIFMFNPRSSAVGEYGQLWKGLKTLPHIYGGEATVQNPDSMKIEFSKDREAQQRVMDLLIDEGFRDLEGGVHTPALKKNAYDLTEEYKGQLGDKWTYSLEDVAALTHILGREGTRIYFGEVVRDGKPLEEALEKVYGPGLPPNKTPEEYLKIFRKGMQQYKDSSQESGGSEVRDALKTKINPAFMTFFPDMLPEAPKE